MRFYGHEFRCAYYINFSCNCVGEQAWETSALRLNAN